MSAFGTFPYYAPPKGLVNTLGVAPNPTLAAWQGCRRRLRLTPTPQPLSIWSPPTCKGQVLRGCFASLDRFPAPSASDRFAIFMEMERGQGGEAVHFTLDALNRPNTRRRGRWVGFATCPCGLASESGVWGKAPRSCFLVFRLLRLFCRYP